MGVAKEQHRSRRSWSGTRRSLASIHHPSILLPCTNPVVIAFSNSESEPTLVQYTRMLKLRFKFLDIMIELQTAAAADFILLSKVFDCYPKCSILNPRRLWVLRDAAAEPHACQRVNQNVRLLSKMFDCYPKRSTVIQNVTFT